MLFNATQAEELRVAIVDGQKLVDLDIETHSKAQKKGNIYKGTITRIEPSLEACFVDYGGNRHGFLPFKEVSKTYFENYTGGRAKIQEVLKEGMTVLVQIEKDERGNKGAALTTFVSMAGRYLVLMPNNPRGGGVSRRIEGEERQELKDILMNLDMPANMSVIARTAGIGRNAEELKWDLDCLVRVWRACEAAEKTYTAPKLIHEESNLIIRAIRDYFNPDIGEILIDTEMVFDEATQFMSHIMPDMLPRLKRYKDHVPLFSRYQIEHQIELAFSRTVDLPSGGAIVIDHTEALVSVDVNSARATKGADIEDTAFRTNLEAAEEVARQMRLRDLGGLVVIDFIDMENSKNQREVENRLSESLRPDRARVQKGKLSRFGLLELSRQRLRPALGESSHESCPRCSGTGFIRGTQSSALHILRLIQDAAMKEGTGAVHVQVPVDVATFLLNEKRNDIYAVEARQRVQVVLIPNTHLETPHYKISRVRGDDLDNIGDAPSYMRFDLPVEEVLTNAVVKVAGREEAAVKNVAPATPAPVRAVVETPSIFQAAVLKVKAWFAGLFGADVAASTEAAPKSTAPRRAETRRPANAKNGRQRAERIEKIEKIGDNAALPQNAQAPKAERPARPERAPRPPREPRPPRVETVQTREEKAPMPVAPKAEVPVTAVANVAVDNSANAPVKVAANLAEQTRAVDEVPLIVVPLEDLPLQVYDIPAPVLDRSEEGAKRRRRNPRDRHRRRHENAHPVDENGLGEVTLLNESVAVEPLNQAPLQVQTLPRKETVTSEAVPSAAVVAPQIMPVADAQQPKVVQVVETLAPQVVVAKPAPAPMKEKTPAQPQAEAMPPKKESKLQMVETVVKLPGLSGMVEPNLAAQARRGNRSVMASSVASALSLQMIETAHKPVPSVVTPAPVKPEQVGGVRRRNSQKLASDTSAPAAPLQQVETARSAPQ
jgi:ribonuclease E